ncbi:MAG TPA: biotin/lipoyl-containing protein, partial [Gemmatimonadaceae bacterium]|nr:biotin/lipoyl-containing protein [Gemmatimonadaceae bacterium]
MPTKVVMEALSPTMEEGRLVKWLKNEGDAVNSGDVIAEVETDKAVMELVARGDGVLRKQLISEGSSAPVGSLIAVIAGADEDVESLVAEAAPASGKKAGPDEASEAAEAKPAATVEPPDSRADAGDGDRRAPAAGEGEEAAGKAPKSNGSGARRTPRREGGPPWPSSIPEAAGQEQGEASMPPQERDRRG